MSDSYGKVIELLAVEENDSGESGYLRVKFSTDTVEWLWEADSETVQSLKAVLVMDGLHKYRLSCHTVRDVMNETDIAQVTRTYREESTRYPFSCSPGFKSNLDEVKRVQHPQELLALSFLSRVHTDSEPHKEENVSSERNGPRQFRRTRRLRQSLKLVSMSVVSIFLVTVLSSFNYSHNFTDSSADVLNQAAPTDPAFAETTVLTPDVTVEAAVSSAGNPAENGKSLLNTSVSKPTKEPVSQMPYVELEEGVTYGLSEGYVALTFDDGPSQYSVEIMSILKEYGVGGTFFFVGTNVKKHPDYVRTIHESGYSIGSHSMTHAKLPGLGLEMLKEEMTGPDRFLEDIIGESSILFRPPYGALDERTESVSGQLGKTIVMWNRDPEDWLTRDQDKIVDYIKQMKASGSIVILHESQAVVDSLPEIITYLKNQNLSIVGLR